MGAWLDGYAGSARQAKARQTNGGDAVSSLFWTCRYTGPAGQSRIAGYRSFHSHATCKPSAVVFQPVGYQREELQHVCDVFGETV